MKRRYLLLTALLTMLVAGCGPATGSGDPTQGTLPEATSEPGMAAPTSIAPDPTLPSGAGDATAPVDAEVGTTAAVLAGDERFSMFMQAITTAGLTETLQGADAVTIFAPNNEAFAKLPPEQLQSLLNDPATLRQLLERHMAQGTIRTGELMDQSSISTINGNVISIVKDGSNLLLDGRANLLMKDIETTNGIIHEIDAFLTPVN
jgi:uncharacterized surface protein with fasciclin (FAS1) repeats